MEAPRGQRGGGSPTVALADRHFPLQLPEMIAPAGQAVRGKAHSTWPLSGTPPPPRTWGLNPAQSWGGGPGPPPWELRTEPAERAARLALPSLTSRREPPGPAPWPSPSPPQPGPLRPLHQALPRFGASTGSAPPARGPFKNSARRRALRRICGGVEKVCLTFG